MPKITKHGGATVAGDRSPPDPEPAEPHGPAPEAVPAALPERPAHTDPKAAWAAYADALGVDNAGEMTKKQLIDATAQDME